MRCQVIFGQEEKSVIDVGEPPCKKLPFEKIYCICDLLTPLTPRTYKAKNHDGTRLRREGNLGP